MVQNDADEGVVVRDSDLASQAEEFNTNALRLAVSLGEAIPENEISLSRCEVYIVARTTRGQQITYTHDCLAGRGYRLAQETRAALRARVSGKGRTDTGRVESSVLRDEVSEQESGTPGLAFPF